MEIYMMPGTVVTKYRNLFGTKKESENV
jgi:hypothetical protein